MPILSGWSGGALDQRRDVSGNGRLYRIASHGRRIRHGRHRNFRRTAACRDGGKCPAWPRPVPDGRGRQESAVPASPATAVPAVTASDVLVVAGYQNPSKGVLCGLEFGDEVCVHSVRRSRHDTRESGIGSDNGTITGGPAAGQGIAKVMRGSRP